LSVDLSQLNPDGISEASADRADRLIGDLEGLAGQVATTATVDDNREAPVTPRTITISRQKWESTVNQIAKTTSENGWTASFARSLGEVAMGDRSGDDRAVADLTKKYLIAAYIARYFRNGAIFSLEFSDADLKKALLEKVKAKVHDDDIVSSVSQEIDQLATDYRKALCQKGTPEDGPCVLLGVIGEQTFVTRAGKSYGFPGVTATLDFTANKKISTNKVTMGDIPPDLVRVVMEAIGDQMFHVPGEKNSTLCEVRGGSSCSSDAIAKQLRIVNEVGDRVEAGTMSTIGAAVRGGWLASLNNEVLANTLTTAAAVTFRKVSEAGAWAATRQCAANRAFSADAYEIVAVRLTK
jgi:hypothetical protein